MRMYTVLGKSETPSEMLWDFARNVTDPIILEHVAAHSQTPPNALDHLARHESLDVRLAVADNPRTPAGALRLLSEDENADVRYALAENHNCPMEILYELATDSNPYVSARALKTVNRISGGQVIEMPELRENSNTFFERLAKGQM